MRYELIFVTKLGNIKDQAIVDKSWKTSSERWQKCLREPHIFGPLHLMGPLTFCFTFIGQDVIYNFISNIELWADWALMEKAMNPTGPYISDCERNPLISKHVRFVFHLLWISG
jgi:hypothetical protein